MDNSSSHIDDALEQLRKDNSIMSYELSLGLKFLRAFLLCVECWSSANDNVREHLRYLMADIGDAFADASSDLEDAEDGGKEKNVVYSELSGKIEQFKPKVIEAYGYLSQSSFRAPSPITDLDLWIEVITVVRKCLQDFVLLTKVVGSLKKQVEVFNEDLWSFNLFFSFLRSWLPSIQTFTEFWVFFGDIATYAARVSYICWTDGMDSSKTQDLIILLSDLQRKIKPCSTETFEMYIGLLKALGSCDSYYIEPTISEFIEHWVPLKDHGLSLLRQGLVFLTEFIVTTPGEVSDDFKLVSIDIKTVMAEAVSLRSTSKRRSESGSKIFQLVGKIEILKAEVVITELMNRRVKDKRSFVQPSETLAEGVKMLQIFFKKPPKGITEKGKFIFVHIEAVVSGAASIYNKFHAIPISGEMIQDVRSLLVNIRLLKAEIFWLELLDRNEILNDNIDNLLVGLEDLRIIASGRAEPNENSDNKYPIFARVYELASEAMSIYHSVCNSRNSENLATEGVNNLLPDLLKRIDLVKAEAKHGRIPFRGSSKFSFPKTHGLGFLEFFLDNLGKLMDEKSDSVNRVKQLLEKVQESLMSLKPFLEDTAAQSKVDSELKILHTRIIHIAYEADYAIDCILLHREDVCYHLLSLLDIIEEIKHTKAQVDEIIKQNKYSIDPKPAPRAFSKTPDASFIIDLEDQEKEVIRLLTAEPKQRDIVSIVGMGGIGKTTLARKLFKDRRVTEQFYPRAWCSVSGVYQKRDLLLQILSYIPKQKEQTDEGLDEDAPQQPKQKDQFDNYSDDDLVQELYRRLMGSKYLIVVDDLCDIQPWHDLRNSFRHESGGGRILITSRDTGICSKVGGSSKPHDLRKLSDKESWTLLETRVFHGEACSKEFSRTGKRIANGCKGLPLAVDVIAGVLEEKKEIDQWEKIAEDINSGLDEDQDQRCMKILGLSYEQLPDHLKACFLYLGAFLGNIEITVQKLLQLWIAEGFVRKPSALDSLEVAEDHLRELISRNLIIATKERSRGGFKFCRVHDMLQTLCIRKAKEENFLQVVKGHEEPFKQDTVIDPGYSGPSAEQHRVSVHSERETFSKIKPSSLNVRSLLFFPTSDPYPTRSYDISSISQSFILLRVLDLETINFGISFPSGIELLKQLRYLAVNGDIKHVPSILAEIWNLETFLVKTFFVKELKIVQVPEAIWSMRSLRHLSVQNAEFLPQEGKFTSSSKLGNLVTLSSLRIYCGKDAEKMMKRFPDLRKLSCNFLKSHDHSSECTRPPVLSRLTKLESLKIAYYGGTPFPCEFDFVATLKKLTIINCHLPTDYVSKIGALLELKVLKLQAVTFDDQNWDMGEEVFESLEYLKLDSLDTSQWTADSETFPSLRRLVLQDCHQLKELPYGFMESTTLEAVELQRCSQSAETSAKEIQEELLKYNKKFKLFIDLLEVVHKSV